MGPFEEKSGKKAAQNRNLTKSYYVVRVAEDPP